jgi:UDP-N-acetylmuramoyl-tripeptide--D-alanyl-D-alanine ligase
MVYNSSPDAVMSALATLKELECSGSKIVALGDMMELGQYSAEEHRKVGREVLGVADVLITVGQRSRATADEAIKTGFNAECVHSFDTSVEAGEFLEKMVKPFDIILVKGSQSIRMERIVKMLMKDSSKAESLLVRQEKEWLDKK